MGKGSALLQRHSNIGIGSFEDGNACPFGWFVGNYGTAVGQGGREYNGEKANHTKFGRFR